MEPRVTRCDYVEFLIFLYFGSDALADPMKVCIRRAYLDFNRTIRGIAGFPEAFDKAATIVCESLERLRQRTPEIDQVVFDSWHYDTCDALRNIYGQMGFPKFTIGQAQKWINMTLKYIFTFGSVRIPGFAPVYKHCHVPIDNIVIGKLSPHGFPKLRLPWSQWNDYAEYLNCQKWIRRSFTLLPLDLELFVWMRRDFDLAGHLRDSTIPEVLPST